MLQGTFYLVMKIPACHEPFKALIHLLVQNPNDLIVSTNILIDTLTGVLYYYPRHFVYIKLTSNHQPQQKIKSATFPKGKG